MCRTELEILEEQVRQKQIDELVSRGTIIPVKSFEDYNNIIEKAKREKSHKLFTNSYLMRAEAERLISLKLLYEMPMENGVGFVEDQISHWRHHLHIDLTKKLKIPKLNRFILIESVYTLGKITEQQERFKQVLNKMDLVHFYETYRGIGTTTEPPPAKAGGFG